MALKSNSLRQSLDSISFIDSCGVVCYKLCSGLWGFGVRCVASRNRCVEFKHQVSAPICLHLLKI